MKLISWNVAHRKCCEAQMEAISLLAPDVVALQEVTSITAIQFQTLFSASGFYVQHSCDHGASLEVDRARCYGEMVASRWAMEPIPDVSCGMPWPERLLSVVIRAPFGEFELHTAYIPPGCNHGWLKIETSEGISKRLSLSSTSPRILCGDFNTPQAELADGRVVTWAECLRRDGTVTLNLKRWERWDKAERGILVGLAEHDLRDVFRQLHGHEKQEFSWFFTRKDKMTGRRFDHVFASRSLNPVRCTYLHSFRGRLSDHSAIEACFEPHYKLAVSSSLPVP